MESIIKYRIKYSLDGHCQFCYLLYISPCLHRGQGRGRVLAAGGAGLGLDAGVRADPGVGVAGVGVEVLHHHVVQHPGLQALDGGEEAGAWVTTRDVQLGGDLAQDVLVVLQYVACQV